MHGDRGAALPDRAGGTVRAFVGVLLVLSLLAAPHRLAAQVPPQALPRVETASDTVRHVGPIGALWRSLLIPGWGQAATGRHVTGALFAVWEGTTMYMTIKAQQEADYFKTSGAPNLQSKRQEVQDWLVLWGFNHLFSGAEAFVAAHLRDFPKDLKLHAVPGGIGLSLPLPRR